MDDPRAGASDRVGDLLGVAPAAQEPRGGTGAAVVGAVALEELDLLAEVLAREPGEVADDALLPARDAVAVVQDEDHAGAEASLWAAMAPRAAIIVPTRGRPSYLDVALRSLCPQADAAGAELLVVLDGPDPASEAVARRHGARAVAHDVPRGLNAARNTAAAATDAELLVFVDDDVEVRPGWLARAPGRRRRAAGRRTASSPARSTPASRTTGYARAGVRGRRSRSSTSAPPTPTPSTPGGRTWRSAARHWTAPGRFDEALGLYGDEQEWQTRLEGRRRADAVRRRGGARPPPGGRRRPAARARARRLPARSRQPPLRRPPGRRAGAARPSCACWPGARRTCLRFRCQNGTVLTAHSAGRLRALCGDLVAPGGGGPATAGGDDFLSGASGTVGGRRGALLRVRDALARRPRVRARSARLRAAARRTPPRRRVLVLGVERPGVPGLLERGPRRAARAAATTSTSARRSAGVAREVREPQRAPGRGYDLAAVDWLLVVDDDVALPRGFLDRFLHVAEDAGLRLAQPAHRLHSHAAWAVTRRRPGVAARATTFVEIGPVTAFHRDTFATLLPFPAACAWAGASTSTGRRWPREHGWPIGVVDATPVGHTLRPAGEGYPREAAADRGPRLPRRPPVRAARRGAHAGGAPVKVAIVSEFYPRAHDPVLGVWAHRQALAARDAGADVRVLVLHRPIPPRATATRDAAAARRGAWRPSRAHATLDGIEVRYVPVPRPAAPAATTGRGAPGRPRRSRSRCGGLRRTLPVRPRPRPQRRARRPTPCSVARIGRAARRLRARRRRPLHRAGGYRAGRRATRRAFAEARLVLANSAGHRAGLPRARRDRGRASSASAPTSPEPGDGGPRRRPADARHRRPPRRPQAPRRRPARARAAARPPPVPALRRDRRRARAPGARAPRRASSGLAGRVELAGQLDQPAALERAPGRATCSSCPAWTRPSASPTSEAMAAGLPAVAARGEPGPEEIAAAGDGAPARGAARRRRRSPRRDRPARRRPRRARRARAAPRARPSRAPSPGSAAAPRRCAPTPTRCAADRHERPAFAPSSSSRTTCRPTAPGPSPRCTRARASSSPSSAGARTTRPPALEDPGVPYRRVERARRPRPRRLAGATGPSCAGRPAASPCPAAWLRGPPRRRAVRAVERAVGASSARPAHVAAAPADGAIYRTAAAVVAYGPHVAAFARSPRARGASHVAPQAVDNGVLVGAAATRAAPGRRPAQGAVRRPRRPGEGPRGAARRLARRAACTPRGGALVLVGAAGASAARRPRRRGAARRPAARRRPRDLYGLAGVLACRRCRLAALPRALGAGGQRGHEPARRDPRLRRRRRRRRRARPRRRHRARRPGRRRLRARGRAAAPGRRPGAARAPGRRRPRTTVAALHVRGLGGGVLARPWRWRAWRRPLASLGGRSAPDPHAPLPATRSSRSPAPWSSPSPPSGASSTRLYDDCQDRRHRRHLHAGASTARRCAGCPPTSTSTRTAAPHPPGAARRGGPRQVTAARARAPAGGVRRRRRRLRRAAGPAAASTRSPPRRRRSARAWRTRRPAASAASTSPARSCAPGAQHGGDDLPTPLLALLVAVAVAVLTGGGRLTWTRVRARRLG